MNLKIRKLVNFEEEIHFEGERAAIPPLRVFGVAAVVKNPWAGRGYVEDLKPEIRAFAPILGKLLTERIMTLAGGADKSLEQGGMDAHEQQHQPAHLEQAPVAHARAAPRSPVSLVGHACGVSQASRRARSVSRISSGSGKSPVASFE